MVSNKHFPKLIVALVVAAVLFCIVAAGFSEPLTEHFGGSRIAMEYESKLFNTDEIIDIDIQMDEDEWKQLLSEALSEEYHACDVIINGTRFYNVGLRTKGNTSLSSIAMDPDTDRYSFKIEFGHFVEGQTCFGLDKLVLNNNYADATNMKEAVIFDMFHYLGADASLYNYARISVNGEYWGVYLALEGVEESFMLRNYGTQDGELYKPDSMNMGDRDEERAFEMPEGGFPDAGESEGESSGEAAGESPGESNGEAAGESPGESNGEAAGEFPGESNGEAAGEFPGESNGEFNPPDMDDGPMGSKGANLNYTDDELASYDTIWQGSVTNTGTKDHQRVVTALKQISEGEDLETYMDVDNLLRYMAVHVFTVNEDSLSGNMAHNYYLYEYKGKLNLIPWDYNLAFGGMGMGNSNASDMINDAIDTPFSGTKFFDKLLENEQYLAQYHEYLRQLTEEYIQGGKFKQVCERFRSQIDDLVAEDPTAFFTYEQYDAAVKMLEKTADLRAESIVEQLDGIIPSTSEGQSRDSENRVDASEIDLDVMGEFGNGDSDGDSRGDSGNEVSP